MNCFTSIKRAKFLFSAISLLILLLSVNAYAQETKVILSEKHQQKLTRIKNVHAKRYYYKQLRLKDSIKQARRLKKLLKQNHKLAQYSEQVTLLEAPDGTKIDDILKKEGSKIVVNQIGLEPPADRKEAKKQLNEQLERQVGVKVPDIPLDTAELNRFRENFSKDSLLAKTQRTALKVGEEQLNNTDAFKSLKPSGSGVGVDNILAAKETLEQTQKELQQAKEEQQLKQKMTSTAGNYLAAYSEKIQQVQSKMSKLKQKYSYLPNSNDLSAAVKRKSMEGTPFWKRFIIGGNLSIKSTTPLTMDLSPQVGYRLNKLLEVGVTGIYRKKFNDDPTAHAIYGFSTLVTHKFYKSFFGYLEGEHISMTSQPTTADAPVTRSWKQTLLLGIGKEISIARWMDMQMIVTVDLLHDNRDPVHSNGPIVVKTGFRIKK